MDSGSNYCSKVRRRQTVRSGIGCEVRMGGVRWARGFVALGKGRHQGREVGGSLSPAQMLLGEGGGASGKIARVEKKGMILTDDVRGVDGGGRQQGVQWEHSPRGPTTQGKGCGPAPSRGHGRKRGSPLRCTKALRPPHRALTFASGVQQVPPPHCSGGGGGRPLRRGRDVEAVAGVHHEVAAEVVDVDRVGGRVEPRELRPDQLREEEMPESVGLRTSPPPGWLQDLPPPPACLGKSENSGLWSSPPPTCPPPSNPNPSKTSEPRRHLEGLDLVGLGLRTGGVLLPPQGTLGRNTRGERADEGQAAMQTNKQTDKQTTSV